MTAPVQTWPEVYPRNPDDPRQANLLAWIFRCSEPGCQWYTAHNTQDGARRQRDAHPCPYTKEHNQMPAGKSMIEKLWDELDAVTTFLMDPANKPIVNSDDEGDMLRVLDQHKGKAQGLAFAIHLMSIPHFADVTAVAKWSARRYKMAQGTREFEPTPGCDGHNPLPPGTDAMTGKPAKTTAKAEPATSPLEYAETIEKQIGPEATGLAYNAIRAGFDDASVMGLVKGLNPGMIAALRAKDKA